MDNIEKDIVIVENKINDFRYMQNTLDEEEKENYADDIQEIEVQAIENILKEHKKNQNIVDKIRSKINERQFELQQEYKDFKDDIRLNTLQEIYYMFVEDKQMKLEEAKNYIRTMIRQQEIPDSAKALGYVYASEAIETVLQVLEEYEKQLDLDYVRNNYISKDKVREKIINLRASCTNNSVNDIYKNQINFQIRILEKLLEEK